DAVLLMADKILDVQHDRVFCWRHRADPSSFALAHDVRQVAGEKSARRTVLKPRQPEPALQAPSFRMLLAPLIHQVHGRAILGGAGAEDDIADARKKLPMPPNRRLFQIEL